MIYKFFNFLALVLACRGELSSASGSSFPCGLAHPRPGNFVVIGVQTAPGDWPWLVTVNLRKHNIYQCAGTLVSQSVVITVAHCVHAGTNKRKPQEFILEFGVYDRIHDRDDVVQRSVKSIELPRGHMVAFPPIYDLAVLVTDLPVTYSNTIIPVCLWTGDRDLQKIIAKKKRGSVVGWGMDELDNDATNDLRLIKLPIVQFDTCTRSNHLTKGRQYCAGAANGLSGICNGDSGSGMYFYRNNHWELKGIVSFGILNARHTCDLNEYMAFTDVTHPEYADWITDIINDNDNDY